MNEVKRLIAASQLGAALELMDKKDEIIGCIHLRDRFESLCMEYHYMLDFIMTGGKDEHRHEMFTKMLEKASVLVEDAIRISSIKKNPYLSTEFDHIAGLNTNPQALIDSLRDKNLTLTQHYEALNNAFLAIFFSLQWKQQEQRLWTAYLLSSDTDTIDSQTIMAAIMLACRESFCPEKFRTMMFVYFTSDNEALRQRALVGCGAVMKGAVCNKELISEFLENEDVRSELMKLMMQIVICADVDKDSERINREIMPELIKHSQHSLSLDDIVKSDEDTLNDILHPSSEETEMEDMEKKIQQMMEMQKSGSDIFYSGFSKMKRYPFFYKLVNWFTPFDINHPDLTDARKKIGEMTLLDHVYRNGPFCDSDKYSFTHGFASVIGSLPEQLKNMLKNGEVGPLGTLPHGEEREITSAYLRRMYLQDLYRFYALSPQVKLKSFFTSETIAALFAKCEEMKEYLYDFCNFLLRHDHANIVSQLLEDKEPCALSSYKEAILYANYWKACGYEHRVMNAYDMALFFKENDKVAHAGRARAAYLVGEYETARDSYRTLHEQYPDVLSYNINYLQSLVQCGEANDEVVNEAYRLDFEVVNNSSVKRMLAWVLLCSHRQEQARELYKQITKGKYGNVSFSDKLCFVDCMLVSGNIAESVTQLKVLIEEKMAESSNDIQSASRIVCDCLKADIDILSKYYEYSPIDAIMLVDAAKGI